MVRFCITILLLLIVATQVQAFSLKVYNREGQEVGRAEIVNDEYVFYNKNGKQFTPQEQLYSPVGVPLKPYEKQWAYYYRYVRSVKY